MASRKFAKSAPRCGICDRLVGVCVCHDAPVMELRTRLCVVVHLREVVKTTNTGTVAARLVAGSSILVHGERDKPVPVPDFSGRRPLVLFPSDDATPLCAAHTEGEPVTLVVPDGSWSQARRMIHRIDWMKTLPRVTLPPGGGRTGYLLRRSDREGGLATMEAIARALGVLDGPEATATLERVFALLVTRTLAARGTPVRAL